MGNHCQKKSVKTNEKKNIIKFEKIKNFQLIYDNIIKRELKDPSDFSIEKLKKKALIILQDALKENNNANIQKALSYDNTNEIILKEYLSILKQTNFGLFEKKIEEYYYSISEDIYMKITGQKKHLTSIGLLLQQFDIFKNYKISGNIDYENENEIMLDNQQKSEITKYFYRIKDKEPSIPCNSSFTKESNLELFLYETYYLLFKDMNKKINKIWEICKDKNLSVRKRLASIGIEGTESKIEQILLKKLMNEGVCLLYYSKFFMETIPNIKKYIIKIYKTITKCLQLENINTDFYIILFIILDLKDMILYEKTTSEFIDKIIEYESPINFNICNAEFKVEINENKAIINIAANEQIIIENYYQYNLEKILNKLTINKFLHINKFVLDKYIKLEYFNSNNYIKLMMKFIEKFNTNIAKSETIKTALNFLYPELKTQKLFDSNFIDNLFKSALNTCYYFPFIGKKGAYTLSKSNTIFFFIPNRTIYEEDSSSKKDRTYFLILNLGIFIYIEFHEILGHYLRLTLSKIIDYDYLSPRSPISNTNESGEYVEFLLFGKRILEFNIKQILYILDIKNYEKNYIDFSEGIKDIELDTYTPSKDLEDMLKEIDIELDILDINHKENIGSLFKDKNLAGELINSPPFLHNCCENFEIEADETLINLLDMEKNINN